MLTWFLFLGNSHFLDFRDFWLNETARRKKYKWETTESAFQPCLGSTMMKIDDMDSCIELAAKFGNESFWRMMHCRANNTIPATMQPVGRHNRAHMLAKHIIPEDFKSEGSEEESYIYIINKGYLLFRSAIGPTLTHPLSFPTISSAPGMKHMCVCRKSRKWGSFKKWNYDDIDVWSFTYSIRQKLKNLNLKFVSLEIVPNILQRRSPCYLRGASK